jgi:hypothetical protein
MYNIYIDNLLRNWKNKGDAGIMFKRNLCHNTLLFTNDQVIIQDSEDKLQKSVYIQSNVQRLQPQNIDGQNKNCGLLFWDTKWVQKLNHFDKKKIPKHMRHY